MLMTSPAVDVSHRRTPCVLYIYPFRILKSECAVQTNRWNIKSKKEIMRSRKHMKQHSPVLTYSDCCCFKHVRQLQQQVLVYDFLLCIYWNPQRSADSFSMFLFSCQLRHPTFQQDNTDRSNNFPHSSPQTIFWSSTGTEGNLHISICWTINI